VLLAVLVALTARAVANEIRQLAHAVPSVADFDSDYPEANVGDEFAEPDYANSSQDIADSTAEQHTEQDGDSTVGGQHKVATRVLGQEFERLLTAATETEASTGQRSITHRRRLQRYLVGLLSYGRDPWNLLDVASLGVVTLSILRWVCHSNIETNSHFAAVGTFLLWIRVIEYLNGLEMTAAYVRMTTAVITDMVPFMLILVLLIVGNAFVLLLLYPQSLELDESDSGSGWHLDKEDEATIDEAFGDFGAALFTVRCITAAYCTLALDNIPCSWSDCVYIWTL
jgi:hypothetical protein